MAESIRGRGGAMSPEQQRIAIAEACGWTQVTRGNKPEEILEHKNPPYRCRVESKIPDYINDLNAIHEAEKRLTRNQRHDYIDALECIAGDLAVDEWDTITATATQRAEAFLKTLNKWEVDP